MSYILTEKLKKLEPYVPISGEYRIRLDANESFLTPSPELMEDIQRKVAKIAFNRYPDPYAQEVIELYAQIYGISPGNITVGNGSDELISVICTSFLERGDKVLTFTPDFSMYKFYCSLTENPVIEIKKPPNMEIDIEQLIDIANKNNVAAIFCSNPCNPTSLGIKASQVCEIISNVKALVILDEAYMDFWDQSLLNEVNNYDNLIILRTCSKAFGLAAIRLGFAVANSTLTKALRTAKSPYNVSSINQAIGAAMLKRNDEINKAINKIIVSRNQLYKGLKEVEKENSQSIKVFETCTNFVFAKLAKAKNIHLKLNKKGISVRLLGDYLRITCGNEYENTEVISAMKIFLE